MYCYACNIRRRVLFQTCHGTLYTSLHPHHPPLHIMQDCFSICECLTKVLKRISTQLAELMRSGLMRSVSQTCNEWPFVRVFGTIWFGSSRMLSKRGFRFRFATISAPPRKFYCRASFPQVLKLYIVSHWF